VLPRIDYENIAKTNASRTLITPCLSPHIDRIIHSTVINISLGINHRREREKMNGRRENKGPETEKGTRERKRVCVRERERETV
jgi:hypothetical protein